MLFHSAEVVCGYRLFPSTVPSRCLNIEGGESIRLYVVLQDGNSADPREDDRGSILPGLETYDGLFHKVLCVFVSYPNKLCSE